MSAISGMTGFGRAPLSLDGVVLEVEVRSVNHRFLDLRAKLDAQLEIRQLCDLMWPHLEAWAPEFAAWYSRARLHKARLAP